MINFIIKYSTLSNIDENPYCIFFNVPYVVCYHHAKFKLQTPLMHEETKRQFVLRGKLNQMI
jgi:hypothetical protein